MQLADHFEAPYIPEFAREYIEGLDRPYNYKDVEIIARRQIADLANFKKNNCDIVLVDTYLIITKVWFEVVFDKYPGWIVDEIQKNNIDLYLLCAPDLPWIPDKVRENGGEKRNWLFKEYEKNLIEFKLPYEIIRGFEIDRFHSACNSIHNRLGIN